MLVPPEKKLYKYLQSDGAESMSSIVSYPFSLVEPCPYSFMSGFFSTMIWSLSPSRTRMFQRVRVRPAVVKNKIRDEDG